MKEKSHKFFDTDKERIKALERTRGASALYWELHMLPVSGGCSRKNVEKIAGIIQEMSVEDILLAMEHKEATNSDDPFVEYVALQMAVNHGNTNLIQTDKDTLNEVINNRLFPNENSLKEDANCTIS